MSRRGGAAERDAGAVGRQLHNVTIYVAPEDFDRMRAFYGEVFGSDPIWQEPGHIACFGTPEMALCVHEEEADHRSGTWELFFWADDLDLAESELRPAIGGVRKVVIDGGEALRAADQFGNAIHVHRRRE